ncbi:hypothetical protein SPAR104_0656 [Streptococcus pneumoniae GA47751]|nr:hypothetical protein SPAR104_0656 [Streptococcus pneumoniae GA47751]
MKKSCDAPREESALLRKSSEENDTGTAESKTDLMRRKKWLMRSGVL